ncbi:MAG: hypothetical protein JW963_21285, partial [Anaerolineales bacterium]|nr:hypothetical protein [Anaerolineales bacterium]
MTTPTRHYYRDPDTGDLHYTTGTFVCWVGDDLGGWEAVFVRQESVLNIADHLLTDDTRAALPFKPDGAAFTFSASPYLPYTAKTAEAFNQDYRSHPRAAGDTTEFAFALESNLVLWMAAGWHPVACSADRDGVAGYIMSRKPSPREAQADRNTDAEVTHEWLLAEQVARERITCAVCGAENLGIKPQIYNGQPICNECARRAFAYECHEAARIDRLEERAERKADQAHQTFERARDMA